MANELERLTRALAERYRLERELGQGGMATVYMAHDLKHDRPVALKVLRPELAAALGAERFLREITVTARLDHPHILPLLDSGEADGLLYYVMPYVEGESLRDRLNRERRLPLDEALAITREVADALGHAHNHGILHRDVKPENILLAGGHARVADFGIARALTTAGGETLTQTGLAVGTPLYMSPEQATGSSELDARSDVYSLGCVLYEMLAGAPPFSASTPQELLARKSLEPPPKLRSRAGAVPRPVERVVLRAMATAPGDRYSSAAELAGDLALTEYAASAGARVAGWRFLVRSRVGLMLIAVLLATVGASVAVFARWARTRWAFGEALPEMQRLVDLHEFFAAYRLAGRATDRLGDNPEFQRLWRESTYPMSIRTTPAGAQVYVHDPRSAEEWLLLGVSPLENVRIPAGNVRYRVERPGFQTMEGTLHAYYSSSIELELQPENERPDMIRVPGGQFSFWSAPAVGLGPYWLDRFEVTNRQFKEFLDRGGYRVREYWRHPVVLEGRTVPWEQALATFVDRTGRPGPSSWELGAFPEHAGNLPVGGISWYEAAAYCESVGKQLPTIYHWFKAATSQQVYSDVLTLSNVRGQEPAPVGTYRGIGPYGHYDMAGNVREWVLNSVGGQRYILGGAWSDPAYMFFHPDAIPPEDRSQTNGIRCASYDPESAAAASAQLEAIVRVYERTPVDANVFRIYANLYSYAPTPLNAAVDSVDETSPHWRRQIISFDAPYGGRTVAHLFLPRTGSPPYQVVVCYPAVDAFNLESSRDMHTWWFDFIVRTGRAVLHPVYEGMYERRPASPVFRERVTHWTLDIRRSIDYLETRDDIDAAMLAYYGFSYGVVLGPIFTAVEPRFRVGVFLGGGIWGSPNPAEVEPTNFAPRVKIPVLMLNGRDDFIFPVQTSQLPLFRLLGTPEQDKRHVLLEGGHVPNDTRAVVKEVLSWLDRYLGPLQ